MTYLLLFLAGSLFCNCIPHLAAGLQGARFPTPFAKPRGVGESLAIVNFLWGSANLFAGTAIVWRRLPSPEPLIAAVMLAVGFLAIGVYLALHFGKTRSRDRSGRPSDGVPATKLRGPLP